MAKNQEFTRDLTVRQQRRGYSTHRSQAKFRGEKYELTQQEFFVLWEPHWQQRGRNSGSIIMKRILTSESWNPNNIVFTTRGGQ